MRENKRTFFANEKYMAKISERTNFFISSITFSLDFFQPSFTFPRTLLHFPFPFTYFNIKYGGAACEPEFNSTKFPENYSALARRTKFSSRQKCVYLHFSGTSSQLVTGDKKKGCKGVYENRFHVK